MKEEIFYLDDQNNIVDKDKATHGTILQTDENGNRVSETYFVKETPQSSGKMVISRKEYEYLKSKGLVDESFSDHFYVEDDGAESSDPDPSGNERAEKERAEKERAERERAERERAERERAERERAERERAERERAEKERAERERAERERAERERAERERAERERAEGDRAERERAERERAIRERAERARAERERAIRERAERARAEREREDRERAEKERLEREREEKERAEKERAEREREEKEREARERAERERALAPQLRWTLSMADGSLLPIPPEGAMIGRGEDCIGKNIYKSSSISRIHLLFIFTPDEKELLLVDVSRHGASIDGKKMTRFEPVKAKSGMKIRIDTIEAVLKADLVETARTGDLPREIRWRKIDEACYDTRFPLINAHAFEEQKDKEKYLAEYSLYVSLLTQYLCRKTSILRIDREIKEKKLVFPVEEIPLDQQDLYQALCSETLHYFYVRNNVYVERLNDPDKAFLDSLLQRDRIVYTAEIEDFIHRTLSLVTYDDTGNGRVNINYGPPTSNYILPNNALLIGARYDRGFYPLNDYNAEMRACNERDGYFEDQCQELEISLKRNLGPDVRVVLYSEHSTVEITLPEGSDASPQS